MAKAKSMEGEIVPHQPPKEETSLVRLIEKVALLPNANPDQVERFLAMHRSITAEKNESTFNDAMARTQADMRPVAADANNPQTRSKYASYAALDRALRPIYTRHGFAPSFNTELGAPENYVRVVCYVTGHGHTRKYQIDMPADGKGAKGGDVMTRTHATGSAVSYGMRYLLKMIFNVAVGEADDDGNAAGNKWAGVALSKSISEKDLATLRELIKKTKSPDQSTTIIKERWKVEDLADLTEEQFEKTAGVLKKRLGE